MLVNPGRKEWSAAAGLLYTGVQVMNPGESASAHRHQASALRFVMEGKGAYTIVDGERLDLGARDFVLTPNGTWHEHGVDADGTQCTWQDGLDIPLMNSLDANFYEVHPKTRQTLSKLSRKNWQKPYSPVFLYKWDESYKALKKETIFHYTNPLTGGPVMPTMGARLELVKEANKTVATPVASSTRLLPATAGRRSAASASIGRRRTSSACRRGRNTATAPRKRRCCSRSMTFPR